MEPLPQMPLVIETQSGREHHFTVEVAETIPAQVRGLMHRESLADGTGMLFIYPRKRVMSMWMKNTLIPLDILFIDDDGHIVKIAANTVPHSTTRISSPEPLNRVLELKGGVTDELAINVGDRVNYDLVDKR